MADAQDVDVVADNFVANDIRVDERPLTEIIADGTSFTGNFRKLLPASKRRAAISRAALGLN